jgi:hypothetical protein
MRKTAAISQGRIKTHASPPEVDTICRSRPNATDPRLSDRNAGISI